MNSHFVHAANKQKHQSHQQAIEKYGGAEIIRKFDDAIHEGDDDPKYDEENIGENHRLRHRHFAFDEFLQFAEEAFSFVYDVVSEKGKLRCFIETIIMEMKLNIETISICFFN